MTETDLSTWLAIADAAQSIGCSTRTIERLARAGKLEQRLRPQAGSPAVAVYNPDDVARIAKERRPDPAPFVLDAVQANGNGNGHGTVAKASRSPFTNFEEARAAMVSVVTDLARTFQAQLSPPSPPVSASVAETKRFLTIPEASLVTGLTATYLRRKCQNGSLPAIKDGAWKIRRKDLEQL